MYKIGDSLIKTTGYMVGSRFKITKVVKGGENYTTSYYLRCANITGRSTYTEKQMPLYFKIQKTSGKLKSIANWK